MNRNRMIGLVIASLVGLATAVPASAYYKPRAGRFLNRDPIGEPGGTNLYRACRNNAISNIDPLGLKPASPIDMETGLKGICNRECECRCSCSSTQPSSAPASKDTRAECLRKCKKDCKKNVGTILDEIKKMEDGLRQRTRELGYQMQPNCGMMSEQLIHQLDRVGPLSHITCAHVQLGVPPGKSGGHQVVGCRPASCPVSTIDPKDPKRPGETYEQWDVFIDLTNWNQNSEGLVRHCFEGGDGEIEGIGPFHKHHHYFLGGRIHTVRKECRYEWQFGPCKKL